MNAHLNAWYRVPEMWLVLVLLGGMVVGSLALVVTAYRHTDELPTTPQSIASPSAAKRANASGG